MSIRLMQFIGLRRMLPKALRARLRGHWNRLLAWEEYARERSFYRPLVRKDALVFDVGANIGVKTAAFLSLGARVVSIEPNRVCADRIESAHCRALAQGRLYVECKAVAKESGVVRFTVFDSNSQLSSASAEFVEYAKSAGLVVQTERTVEAVTLDQLVTRYGMPDYIKVDVEGLDADVLRGLTSRPRLLSFEYHTAEQVWKNTRDCFQQIARLGFTRANLTEMVDLKFVFRSWVTIDEALAQLQSWRQKGDRWGDVLVR